MFFKKKEDTLEYLKACQKDLGDIKKFGVTNNTNESGTSQSFSITFK